MTEDFFLVRMCQNTKFVCNIAYLKFFRAGIELKKKKFEERIAPRQLVQFPIANRNIYSQF